MPTPWERAVADHREVTRHRIIDAATTSLREEGLTGTSMTAIAERAGISRPTLYKHFPDVDHIMAALVTEGFAAFRLRLETEVEPDWPAVRRLTHLVHAHVQQYASETDRLGDSRLEAGMSPVVHEAVRRELADHHARVVAILRAGMVDGSFRHDLDPDLHAEFLQHLLGGLRRTVHRRDRDPASLAEEVIGLLLGGLQTPGPAPRADE